MKVKILSLLLSVTLLFFSVIPVSADDFYDSDGSLELLDYGFLNGEVNHFTIQSGSSPVHRLDIPFGSTYTYIDVLVRYSFIDAIPTLTVSYSGKGVNLSSNFTGTIVADNLVRYQGRLTAFEYDYLNFKFSTSSSATNYGSVYSCRIFQFVPSFKSIDFYAAGNFNDHVFGIEKSGSGDPVSASFYDDYSDTDDHSFHSITRVPSWKNYDFLDCYFSVNLASVKSVSCNLSKSNLSFPFTVSYLDGGTASTYTVIHVRVDLTSINKSTVLSDDQVSINISGELGYGFNAFQLNSCIGTVVPASLNSDLYWYSKFISWFTNIRDSIVTWGSNIVSALTGDTSSGDQFQEDIQEGINDLDEAAGVMDSVSKPDIGSINVSMDEYASAADLSLLTSPVSVFFELDLFKSIIIMSILFATVSFVLFGKR